MTLLLKVFMVHCCRHDRPILLRTLRIDGDIVSPVEKRHIRNSVNLTIVSNPLGGKIGFWKQVVAFN